MEEIWYIFVVIRGSFFSVHRSQRKCIFGFLKLFLSEAMDAVLALHGSEVHKFYLTLLVKISPPKNLIQICYAGVLTVINCNKVQTPQLVLQLANRHVNDLFIITSYICVLWSLIVVVTSHLFFSPYKQEACSCVAFFLPGIKPSDILQDRQQKEGIGQQKYEFSKVKSQH